MTDRGIENPTGRSKSSGRRNSDTAEAYTMSTLNALSITQTQPANPASFALGLNRNIDFRAQPKRRIPTPPTPSRPHAGKSLRVARRGRFTGWDSGYRNRYTMVSD